MRRLRVASREKLLPIVVIAATVWVAVISYGFVTAVSTKLTVDDIQKPTPKEDREISDRRIGTLTQAQLLRLGAAIKQAQRRAIIKERHTSASRDDLAPGDATGTARAIRATPDRVLTPSPTPSPKPSPESVRPPTPTAAPSTTVAQDDTPSAAAATPTAVIGATAPLPLKACLNIVRVNC